MPPSWRLALIEIRARPTRTGLLTAAVALSSSLVVMACSLVATAQAGFERALVRLIGAADARIVHQFSGRFDEAILDRVRTWPGVSAATGRTLGSVTLVRRDGLIDPRTGRPHRLTPEAVGIEPDLELVFRDIPMAAGRMVQGLGEVVIDPLTAAGLSAEVGTELLVQRFGEPLELRVVGVYQRPTLGTLQRPRVFLDRRTLAEAVGRAGQLTSIAIIMDDAIDVQAFCQAHRANVEQPLVLEPADMARSGLDRRVKVSRLSMLVGAVLTFLCAWFIVVTGLSSGVVERQRELAILRCLGGRRRQLVAGQIGYGLILGATGGVAGIPMGAALGVALARWSDVLSQAEFRLSPLGIRLALVGACSAGVLGAIIPAAMASRVSPLQAMTRAAHPLRRRRMAGCAVGALLLLCLQLGLMRLPGADARFWAYAWVGLPALYLGYFLAAPLFFAATCGLLAPVLDRVARLPRGMLKANAMATPYRYGFTAGALMIGVSLLVADWSNGQALLRDWLDATRLADGFVIRSTGGISRREQEAIARLPFVGRTCPIGYLPLRTVGRQVFGVEGLTPNNVVCVGFDPECFFDLNAVEWQQGDPQQALPLLANGSAVLVADRFLTARGIGVGDRIALGSDEHHKEYEIAGVVTSAGLDIATELFGVRNLYNEYEFSCVFMDWRTVARDFHNDEALIVQVELSREVSDEEAAEGVTDAVPGVIFRSARWIKQTVREIAASALGLQSAVAFCAMILAVLGVGNIIMAGIHGRRFEYGVMRAVGASRGVLVRLVSAEAVLLAAAGAGTGTALGMHLAWATAAQYRDLVGIRLSVPLPVWPTAAGWAAVMVMTVLAAAPAMWALVRRPPVDLVAAGRAG